MKDQKTSNELVVPGDMISLSVFLNLRGVPDDDTYPDAGSFSLIFLGLPVHLYTY